MLLLILLYKDVMTKLSNRKFSPLFCTILIILRVLVRKLSAVSVTVALRPVVLGSISK